MKQEKSVEFYLKCVEDFLIKNDLLKKYTSYSGQDMLRSFIRGLLDGGVE